MAQLDQLSVCPGCSEPTEDNDRYCGVCGTDLRAAAAQSPAPAQTSPQPSVPAQPSVPPRPAQPPAAGGGASPWHPDGVPAQGEFALPPAGHGGHGEPDFPLQQPAAGGTGDHPATLVDGTVPAGTAVPDPRTSPPGADPEQGQGPRCVACRAGTVDADGYCENCGHKQPHERDHMEEDLPVGAAVSDRGRRHHRNEDHFAIAATTTPEGSTASIAVVCDGVSSATRPDEASAAASRAAADALSAALPRGVPVRQAMHEALHTAARAVEALAEGTPPEPDRNAPACTIVAAVVADDILTVGWVGDSRAYWVPHHRAAQSARLTEDDSWAAQMVAAGLMEEDEAYADSRAHAITGWLGADSYDLDPHTAAFAPDAPGVVVVCTDGLWNYAESSEELTGVTPADAVTAPLHAARQLVAHALHGGGHDNITVAVLPFPAPNTPSHRES